MKNIIAGIVILGILISSSGTLILAYDPLVDDQSGIVPDDDLPPISYIFSQNVFIYLSGTYSTFCPQSICVYWSGTDAGVSGLAYFDVQYRIVKFEFDPYECHPAVFPPDPSWFNPVERSEWIDWQMHTENTSATLDIELDMVYFFRCRAVDYAGNVEPWPRTWDSYTITIGIENPQEITQEFIESVNNINEDTASEKIKDLIYEYRTNQAPVADAGGDCSGELNKSPRIYDNAEDAVEEIDPHQRYTEVEFNGSGSYDPDGEIVEYLWDFGDGGFGSGEITSHRYTVPGEYNVTLTVVDSFGKIDQDSIVCTIGIVC